MKAKPVAYQQPCTDCAKQIRVYREQYYAVTSLGRTYLFCRTCWRRRKKGSR